MYRTLCWIHSSACASMAFFGSMSDSPTPGHRMWVGGSVALMILLNGFMWSLADTEKAKAM